VDERDLQFCKRIASSYHIRWPQKEWDDIESDACLGFLSAQRFSPTFHLHLYLKIIRRQIADGLRTRHHLRAKSFSFALSIEHADEDGGFDIEDHVDDYSRVVASLDQEIFQERAKAVFRTLRPGYYESITSNDLKALARSLGVSYTRVIQMRKRAIQLLIDAKVLTA